MILMFTCTLERQNVGSMRLATVRSQVLIPRYFVVVIYNELKQKQAQKPSI